MIVVCFKNYFFLLLITTFSNLIFAPLAYAIEEGEEEEGLFSPDSLQKKQESKDLVRARFFPKKNSLELYSHGYANVLTNKYSYRFLVLSGGSIGYHFSEHWFMEAHGDYFPTVSFFNELKPLGTALSSTVAKGQYIPDISKEVLHLGLSVGFSPIYGKINFISTYVQNFDISLIAGIGLLQMRTDRYQVLEVGEDIYDLQGPIDPKFSYYLAPHIGGSIKIFLTKSLSLRTDLKLLGHLENAPSYTSETLVDGDYPIKTSLKTSVILGVGVSGVIRFRR